MTCMNVEFRQHINTISTLSRMGGNNYFSWLAQFTEDYIGYNKRWTSIRHNGDISTAAV